MRGTCDRPPAGWFCTLSRGHDGPCPTHADVGVASARARAAMKVCVACGGFGADARRGDCETCGGDGYVPVEVDDKFDAAATQPIDMPVAEARLRPFAMVRVVYRGEAFSSRIEAVASDGHGGEQVIDIPVEAFYLCADVGGSKLVLVLGKLSFEVDAEVAIAPERLAELRKFVELDMQRDRAPRSREERIGRLRQEVHAAEENARAAREELQRLVKSELDKVRVPEPRRDD